MADILQTLPAGIQEIPPPDPNRKPTEVKPVSEIEARELLAAGTPKEQVITLIRDRARLVGMQEEEKERERLANWQKQLDAQSAPARVEDYQEEKRQLAIAEEYKNAQRVDPVKTWDAPTLAKNKSFSLEAYVAENPESLHDDRADKLAEVWRQRHLEPITAGDVALGTLKLPVTTAKMLWHLGKGVGTSIYDAFSPLASEAIPSIAGALTGQGPEFQREIDRIAAENQRKLASDLAGLEQGGFNFVSWISNQGKNLPRRLTALGFKGWKDVPADQLRKEFQESMGDYLQSLEIAKGEGAVTQALGGEIVKEVKERGQELDEDRVAALAEADPLGFLMFGQAFRVAGAGVRGAKKVVKRTVGAPLRQAEELARARTWAGELRQSLPPGDPYRMVADTLVESLEKSSTTASKSLDTIARVTTAADRLAQAQLRLRMAQDAVQKFGASPERTQALEAARAALTNATEAAQGQMAVSTLARIQNALENVSGVNLGVSAAGVAARGLARVAGAGARTIEAAPTLAGIGAIVTGHPVAGLALLFGQRAVGIRRVSETLAKPVRAVQAGLEESGKALMAPVATSQYQKALRGLTRGSVEVVGEALKGVPVDVGFALALADSPEEVQNMSGYATAFKALHASGRPLARFVQAVRTDPMAPQAPAFLPKAPGVVKSAAGITENWRRSLPEPQQRWLGAAEQWLREIGSPASVYGMGEADYKAFLTEQHRRRTGQPPTPEEQANIDLEAQTRGVFLQEVIGDNGQPGQALVVTDAQAIPHEGAHAFQNVLGVRGNEYVDHLTRSDFTDAEWNAVGRDYVKRLTGKTVTDETWRQELQDRITPELLEQAGGNKSDAADLYIAREVAAETFDTLFRATGGRPQARTSLTEKLASVVDRTAKFFGVDLLADARSGQLGVRVSGQLLDAIRSQVQRQAGAVAEQRAAGTLPPVEPSARPTVQPPAPVAQRPAGPVRPENLRRPPITPEIEDEFRARTPERLNINMAREMAKNLSPESQQAVEIIAQALQRKPGEPVMFELENYSVIPDYQQAALSRDVRRAEQAIPEALRDFYLKRIAVTRFLSDNFSGGKLQLAAMSMDKVLANIFQLQERLAKAKALDLSPYEHDPATGALTENGWHSVTADLISYTTNQANGYRGGGKALIRPEEASRNLRIAIPEETPNYRPTVLPDRVEQYLNTIMGLLLPKTTRETLGVPPGNLKGQVLREAQGEPLLEPADVVKRKPGQVFKRAPERTIQEVNPLRQEMNRRGVDTRQLLDVTERLNVDRLQNVTPRFELQFNLPATDVIRAGFLPRAGVAERPEFAEREGRRVERAAFRLPNGELITGTSHFDALLRGINEGRVPRESLERGVEDLGMEDGFVDNQGNFLTRNEAFDLSQEAGQITPEAAKSPSFRGEELESTKFQEARQFLPAERKAPREEERKLPEGFKAADFQGIPDAVVDHTVDTLATPTGRKTDMELTKPLAQSGVPVNQDGGVSAGPAVQALPREWKQWLDKYFLGNPEVRAKYSQREMNEFARGMEQTAKMFGDFSEVPQEVPGSPIRDNADPMFGLTFDLTTVCPKQDQFVAITKALEKERGRIYTAKEKATIGEMLRESGQATCWICYGQAARNAWDEAAQHAADVVNAAIKEPDWKKVRPARLKEIFGTWKTDGAMREFLDANIATLKEAGEVTGPRLRELLRGEAEPATPAEQLMVDPINVVVQGAVKANAPKGFAPYVDQLLSPAMQKEIDFFNKIAGFRLNSQSDFRIWHTLDLAQFLSHLQTKNGQAHVYTRMDPMLRIFGKTGVKFNMSVEASDPVSLPLGARVGNISREQFNELKKKHGDPLWDDMNSFPEAQVDYWRKELPTDAGSMLVAANDYQVWWGLDSPKIDMMIPFHQGSVKAETTAFYGARDYSREQHEVFPKDWMPGETRSIKLENGEKISLTMGGRVTGAGKVIREKPLINRELHKNSRERYLEITSKFGIRPKFERFSGHENYMKLVRDAAREPMKQRTVDATKIDWDAAMKLVDEYVESGAFDAETKPNESLLRLVRDRLATGDVPVSPVIQAGEAQTIEEIIKTGRKLRAKNQIIPPRGPGDPSVFSQVEAARKGSKRANVEIKPRRK